MKLLVVDDDPLVVEELCEFLDGFGYQCIPSYSSEEAIRAFNQDPDIAIVLSDLSLPGLNGIQLMAELRLIAGADRPFEALIFTGHAERDDVIEAMRAGVADYYQKPILPGEIFKAVKRLEERLESRRIKPHQLGHLNNQLQSLADSIKELYQGKSEHFPTDSGGRIGENKHAEPPELFHSLTPRQLAVARLVGRGLTNYQIACELGITENTIKLYVSQVLRLTGMHNRTQLALALSPHSRRDDEALRH